MMPKWISTRIAGSALVVTVQGELDLTTAPQLREPLVEAVQVGYACVVVDLAEVTFIDSTALSVLAAAMKRLQSTGGSLRVVSTNERVLKVFRLSGLDGVLAIFVSVEEALAGSNLS